MQKVITINLNGNAYQVEERGYDALTAYLDAAQRELRDNPDRLEIVADLEQAIADKCRRCLSDHKTVVTAGEVDTIIGEMGPVVGGAAPSGDGGAAPGAASGAPRAPRRLYRIPDGAMIAGVCNGLAAFLHIDPTIVRLIFAALVFFTGGGFVIVYIVLALVVPEADTSEERAAAYGEPFNAQRLIDRAKQQYADKSRNWSQAWRREQRAWRRQWRRGQRWRDAGMYGPPPAGYGTRILAGVAVPVLTLVSIALFWMLLFAIFSLVTRQELFGTLLPDEVPLWAGILILVVIYQAIAWPLHTLRRSSHYLIGGPYHGTVAALDVLLSLALVLGGMFLAVRYLPEVREFLKTMPDVIRSFR